MRTKVDKLDGTSRMLKIEVSSEELHPKFDQVYARLGRVARVPGFRPGHVPRDLLEVYYREKAEEEVIKQAVHEYYLKAIIQEKLDPVVVPEIEDVQFKNQTLYFNARVDVKPKLSLKAYKNLKIKKKKIKIEPIQIDQILERLRQTKMTQSQQKTKDEKEKIPQEVDNQALAKALGFNTQDELKETIRQDLQANTELQIQADMERQLIEQLFKKATLDIPQSLVNSQTQELLNQLKLDRILQGEKKEDVESRAKELEEEARKEAIRQVKLSFILEEIAQLENIQVNEEDLDNKIEGISQRSGKTNDEVRQYLEKQNLIPYLKAQLRDKKTIQFLLKEADITEE